MEGPAATGEVGGPDDITGGEKKTRLFREKFTRGRQLKQRKRKQATVSAAEEEAELSDHSIAAPAKKSRAGVKDETITISSADEDSSDEENEEESAPATAAHKALEKTADASATMLAALAATRVSLHEMLELNVDGIRDSGRLCAVITALRSRNRTQESMLDTKRGQVEKDHHTIEEGQQKLEELKKASRKERSALEDKVRKLEGKVAGMARVPRHVPIEAFNGTPGGQQDVSALRNELRSVKRQLKKEQDDSEHLKATIMLQQDEALSEKLTKERQEKDIEEAETKITELQAEIERLNTVIDATSGIVDTLRKDHDGLQVDILAKTTENSMYLKQNSVYLKELMKKHG